MHRTEGTNYAPGNLFKNGPPGTVVEQEWLNAVQEEIANVIETAGISLLSAATDSRDQLMTALQAMFSGLSHKATHIRGGADEVDGDKLDIDWNPSGFNTYVPTTSPAEADHLDHLTAHLKGIENKFQALRKTQLIIYDGTNANTIKVVTNGTYYLNGKSIPQEDNLGKGGDTGSFSLSAAGDTIQIDESAFGYEIIGAMAELFVNECTQALTVRADAYSGGIAVVFYKAETPMSGNEPDLTAIMDTGGGHIAVDILYFVNPT